MSMLPYFLDDDALLYDGGRMFALYGNLVPEWKNDDTNSAYDDAQAMEFGTVSVEELIKVSTVSMEDLRKLSAALNTAAGRLENGKMEQERLAPSLRFPDPNIHTRLFRVIMNGTRHKIGQTGEFSILILYGLITHNDRSNGVKADDVIDWLRMRSDEVAQKIAAFDEVRIEARFPKNGMKPTDKRRGLFSWIFNSRT